jgi:hypothetical protein
MGKLLFVITELFVSLLLILVILFVLRFLWIKWIRPFIFREKLMERVDDVCEEKAEQSFNKDLAAAMKEEPDAKKTNKKK